MKIIEKDILTVEKGIICQQVNCQGIMGSGLAKQIREKWPQVFLSYKRMVGFVNHDFELLNRWGVVPINPPDLFVANIFGQLNYGYDGKRYTDYGALNEAFRQLSINYESKDFYFPFNFGCDRGGASWDIVKKMIEYYFPAAIICKLPD